MKQGTHTAKDIQHIRQTQLWGAQELIFASLKVCTSCGLHILRRIRCFTRGFNSGVANINEDDWAKGLRISALALSLNGGA
jgi:hypothetical protein